MRQRQNLLPASPLAKSFQCQTRSTPENPKPRLFCTAVQDSTSQEVTVAPPNDNTIVTVGPQGDYTKIQDAIDAFKNGNAGFTTIKIADGVYDEQLYLEGITAGANLQVRPVPLIGLAPQNLDGTPNDALLLNSFQGLQILGDTRPWTPGKYYINGYENASSAYHGVTFWPNYVTQNGYQLYPPVGTNYAISNLQLSTDRTVLTVTMSDLPEADPATEFPPFLEDPVFDSIYLDIRNGDQVILSESNVLGNYQSIIMTIDSVAGNTITFTSPVPPVGQPQGVDFTQPGASLTFLPRVILRPVITNAYQENIITVNKASFSMTGICLDLDASTYSNQLSLWGLLINDSEAYLSNIVVTNQNSGGFYFFLISAAYDFVSSDIYLIDGWRGLSVGSSLVSVNWPTGFTLSGSAIRGDGFIFATQSYATGMEANSGSTINLRVLQILGVLGNGIGCLSLGLNDLSFVESASVEAVIFDIVALADAFAHGVCLWASRLYVNNPAVRVERCYNVQNGFSTSECDCCAVYISQASAFSIYAGFFSSNPAPGVQGPPFTQYRKASVFSGNQQIFDPNAIFETSPQTAICVDMGGIFNTKGDLIFENNDLNYATYEIGIFNSPKWSQAPHNVFQLSQSQKLDNAFLNQALLPGAKLITLNPAEINPCGGVRPYYTGKTYTVYSKTANSHIFELTQGTFIGSLGVGTKLKFLATDSQCRSGKAAVGAYVTFTVIDEETVLIKDTYGVKML